MGAVTKALKRAGSAGKVVEYRTKAMAGDYNNLLAVSMEYVDFDLGMPYDGEDVLSGDDDEDDAE